MRSSSNSSRRPLRTHLMRGVAAVMIGAAALPPLAALAQSYGFSSFQVSGNARVETETILSYLGISRGENVSAAELNAAGQRLRDTGLFDSVEIVPNGNTLTIRVVEFPTINRIAFEGNSRLRDDDLARLVTAQERRIFNPTSVEADVATLTQAYAAKGMVNAVITPQIIRQSDNRVDLVFEIAETGVTEIERIAFAGNREFSDRRLRGVLSTKQAGALRLLITRDTYDPARIEFDKQVLTDFYRDHGYVDFTVNSVDVALTRQRDAYLVTFDVTEGQQFTLGDITVTSDLAEVDTAAFEAAVRAEKGDVYSPVTIERDISRMEDLAESQGLRFIRVNPVIDRDDQALALNLTYKLERGEKMFIERIDISGNATTLDRVVRQQFRVAEGDPLNARSIRQSAERIRSLGYFADAQVNAREGSAPDQVVVDVQVTEQPTGSLSFGANYNSDTGAALIASFSEQNFLGRGQSVNAEVNVGASRQTLSLKFEEPFLFGRDVRLGFDTSYRQTNNESARYDTTTARLRPSLGFDLSESVRATVFGGFDYSQLTNPAADLAPEIQADVDAGGIWAGTLGYELNWDNRRTGNDPTVATVLRLGQQYALSDAAFVKTTASAGVETKVLGDALTLRGTLEGGYLASLNGNSRVTDRFLLNSSQIRGFDLYGMGPRYVNGSANDALGGNVYAVARLEAEFPIGLPEEYGFNGGAFFDYGSLWDPGFACTSAEYLYCDFTPRSIAGVSLFWSSPLGPLRFNWSTPISVQDEDRTRGFDLTLSTRF